MFLGTPRDRQLLLLAPFASSIPTVFRKVQANEERREKLISELQRLRGAVYLAEGAIEPWQLDAGGRHIRATDRHSWHLLSVDRNGKLLGCARLLSHPENVRFQDLEVKHSAVARSLQWGAKFRDAVEQELVRARRRNFRYAELGGWALAEEIRGTTEALRMAMSVYALTQILGGFVGISAATRRNASASILRRIGGRPLEVRGTEIPSYYDPQYRCEMELLRFDSDRPNPRYAEWVNSSKEALEQTPVLSSAEPLQPWQIGTGFDIVPAWRPRVEK